MKIVRIQYNIEFVHIITFNAEYRAAIAPYFAFDNVRYGIENENTIEERVKLVFTNECVVLFLRKEGINFMYEGNSEELLDPNGIMKLFWDLYERVKLFEGYKGTKRHSLAANAVEIQDKEKVNEFLEDNSYWAHDKFPFLVWEYTMIG
ncbi:MAG: hypothetical protein IH948_09270 [Bacteroidetes bacterium]|nr:hypothetical protein [Bacteroidota bacterium]